jgi:hypothetical protein
MMLLIPLFLTDLRNGLVSVEENRILANRPPLSSINHPRTFIQNFNEWFNDHIGFREKFISLYRTLNRFQKEGSQYREGYLAYIVGKEGHHFYTGPNHKMVSKFQGYPIFTNNQLQLFAQKLADVRNYLAEKDIPFIVMFCTDKESIYPEYYPETIRRGPEPNQLDFITSYLKNNTAVDVFNIRQALVDQKKHYLLYPKRPPGDIPHYNEIGAFFAYRELMNHINTHYSDIVPYSLDDIDIDCDENGVADISFKEKTSFKQLNSSFFDNVDVHRPFDWDNLAFENLNTDSLTILAMRDSYFYYRDNSTFISKYIAQHFNKTILISYSNIVNLKQYVDTFTPDIVVFEAAERGIDQFFYCLNELDL